MNNVVLSGRLTKDADVRYTQGENATAVARFTLAVDDYNGTDYPSIKALGKQAEWVERWTHKGTKVELTGRLKTGHYTNRDGKEVYYTEVLVSSIGFGETKQEAEQRVGREQQAQTQALWIYQTMQQTSCHLGRPERQASA